MAISCCHAVCKTHSTMYVVPIFFQSIPVNSHLEVTNVLCLNYMDEARD